MTLCRVLKSERTSITPLMEYLQIIIGVIATIGVLWNAVESRKLKDAQLLQTKELSDLSHESNIEIERLKAEINNQSDMFRTSLMMTTQFYSEAHKKIVESVDFIWENLLLLREFSVSTLTVYELVEPREVDVLSATQIASLVTKNSSDLLEISNIVEGSKQALPYISNKLWVLFWTYKAFILRLSFKVVEGSENGKLPRWNMNQSGDIDNHLLKILKVVFTEDELSRAYKEPFPVSKIESMLQVRILSEMNFLIFGKYLADTDLATYDELRFISPSGFKNYQ